MRLEDLRKFNMPETIIDMWRRRQGDYLLPLQEKAIRAGLLSPDRRQPGNLLIAGPTSAGKTFCGEIAAVAALVRRRKVIMLVPLKSMAEERYAYYHESYAAAGIRMTIVTGDHPENDAVFAAGRFDLAIVIYEKFNRFLTGRLDFLRQVGLVIVDEIQMIADPERGGELEILLAKIIGSPYEPRMVALSAVLDDPNELADWLESRVVSESVRPVDLLQGVAREGYFYFRSFNSGREGREKCDLRVDNDESGEGLIEFLKKDESCQLVFLKSRRETIEAAIRLAGAVRWPSAERSLASLAGEEPGFLERSLRLTLSRGIAFHNADLTPRQRKVIEEGYHRREIRVIFATTTLAMGVNLPAETVILETMKYVSGASGGKAALVPMTPGEFRSIAGRAGRFGVNRDDRPGKAIIPAGSDFEQEVLWSEYIDGPVDFRPVSALSGDDPADVLLELIAAGFGGSRAMVQKGLEATWYARQGGFRDEKTISRALECLVEGGFITVDLKVTDLGAATAGNGLKVLSVRHYRRLIDKRRPESLFGWLFLALSGPQFDCSRVVLTARERRQRLYEKWLYRDADISTAEIAAYTGERFGREPLGYRWAAALKASLLLRDWAAGWPVTRIEKGYRLHHGQIINLADNAAWLLGSIGRVLAAIENDSGLPATLEAHAFGVRFGIESGLRSMHRIVGSLLNRLEYRKLAERGVMSIELLAGADHAFLDEIIRPEEKLKSLMKLIENNQKEEVMTQNAGRTAAGAGHKTRPVDNISKVETSFSPSLVELVGSYEKERYLVKIDGRSVWLTGKSFKYLARLALARIGSDDGWIFKDDIEIGFNQARYLYRLKQEIQSGGFSWAIFENNRLGYYRLALESSKIRLNYENLKDFPDYDVNRAVSDLAPRLVG